MNKIKTMFRNAWDTIAKTEYPAKGKVDWDAINANSVDFKGSKTLVANAIMECVERGARMRL